MADTLTQSESSRRYVNSTATSTEVVKLLCCLCNSTVTEQALLLHCLHCCCARCAAAAVTAAGSRDGVREQLPPAAAAASVSVTCPHCQEVTEVAAVARGGLLSAVARLAKAAADGRKAGYADGGGSPSSERRLQCDFCLEEGIAEQVAEHWCGDCRRGLCASCLLAHNRFNRQHRAVSVSLASPLPQSLLLADSDASGAMAQCGRHSAGLEMFCLTCERLRCLQCEGDRQCLAANHNMCASRGSDRVADLAGRLLANGRRAEAELRARRAQLPTTISADRLHEVLDAAKRAHVDALAFNKRRLLDMVEIAHRKAESDLLSCYERVATEVAEAARAARLLERRADYSLAYADAALGGVAAVACPSGSSTAAALLPQLKNVQQRLQTLADVCALPATSAAAALADPARLVILDVEPPAELDVIVARCLGVARPASSELGGAAGISGQEQLPDSGCTSLQSDRSISPAGSLSGMPLAADNGCDVPATLASSSTAHNEPLLCLAGRPPAAAFRATVKCWDMAITKDGTVLLAAYAEGLREYDIDGRELSGWVPSQPQPRRPGSSGGGPNATLESVYSVDVLSDGRVAVGLLRSRRVVVLRRQRLASTAAGGGFGWFDELCVELRSQPWRLACHGDLVAVAYSRYERAKYVPGPSLDLVSMSDRSVKLSRTLKYNVVSIAVAEQSIIVASDRQQLSTDPLSRWFIVDSYNHQGEQLWRHECEDSIYDIVTEPFGQLIYVAVGDSRRVIAIRGEDGHGKVIEVLARAADGPVRLSLCHSGQHSALAVLLFDLQSVNVYSS